MGEFIEHAEISVPSRHSQGDSGVGKHTYRSRDGGFHIEIIKGQQDAPHCEYPEKQHGVGSYGRRYPCRDRLSVHHDSPDHIWMYLLQQASFYELEQYGHPYDLEGA